MTTTCLMLLSRAAPSCLELLSASNQYLLSMSPYHDIRCRLTARRGARSKRDHRSSEVRSRQFVSDASAVATRSKDADGYILF